MADTIESVDVAGVHGQVALNADGSAIGTPVGGATSANQTNGTQKTQIVDAGGEAVTVTGGKLDVNATASLAGEAIPATGATTAVGVQIVDGSGNQITSFGGGTQYTEDAAAAANPVGNALIVVREDARAGSLTTADGDNVALRGNNKGELYVKTTDSDALLTTIAAKDFATQTTLDALYNMSEAELQSLNSSNSSILSGLGSLATESSAGGAATSLSSIDSKTPALGQALAAASVPVILPAATISTLTPPAAITGFALESGGNLAGVKTDTAAMVTDLAAIEVLLGTIDTDTGNIATEVAGLLTDTELRAAPVVVDLGANNDVTVTSGTVTANAGTNLNTSALALETGGNLAAAATSLATLDNIVSGSEAQVDIVAPLPAGTNNIGDVDVLSTVPPTPNTSGGYDIFRSIDLDESEEDVKTSAGKLYGYYFFNKAATSMFLKFYNATAASVTVGTTTPVLTLGLPAGGAGHVEFSTGIPFSTAISAAVTTGIADNDTGAPAANDVSINIFYK